jgi:hypothetical protein
MTQQNPRQRNPGQPFVQPHVQQHVPPQWQGQPPYGWYPQQPPPAKRRRIFPWIFLAVQVLFLIWIISAIVSVHGTTVYCDAQYTTQAECNNAAGAGVAIGIGLIIFFWALVDVILGVGYLVMRRR